MTMTKTNSFRYELAYSEVPPEQDLDSRGNKVTTIQCRGQIVLETKDRIKEIFQSTPFHGRIIFDLSDVDYLDSAGLGTLLSLKLSAVKQGGVGVSYTHMTARVLQLLRIANLTEWLSS
jgi:anti-anti-sigma factor